MYKRLAIGITLLLAIMVLLVMPAMACPPELPTCPPGEVWGITGQDCQQVYIPPVYGNCQNCPSHTEQVCDHYRSVPRWESEGYHSSNDCKNHGHSSSWCNTVDHQVCDHYDTETVYDCNYNDNFIKDNCGNHRGKPLITPGHFEEQCTPTYGCIAVSCPAIPCLEGQDCVDAQCLPHTCPRIPCESGYSCQDNQCVPDGSCPVTPCNPGYDCQSGQCVAQAPVCEDIVGTWIYTYTLGGDYVHTMEITDYDPVSGAFSGTGYYNADPSYTWDITGNLVGEFVTYHILYTGSNAGYYVDGVGTITEDCILMGGLATGPGQEGEWSATKNPAPVVNLQGSNFSPYTESACQEIINAQYPMDSIDPSTLPMLNLKNTYVSAAFHYTSQFDCVDLAYYTKGEPSFDSHCTEVEWYNRVQEEIHSYGGMPILTALNPAQAICVLAVKNSPAETTLPVTITLTDSHGNVGDVLVSSNPVIRQCYRLPEDFSECRLRGGFSLHMPWVD